MSRLARRTAHRLAAWTALAAVVLGMAVSPSAHRAQHAMHLAEAQAEHADCAAPLPEHSGPDWHVDHGEGSHADLMCVLCQSTTIGLLAEAPAMHQGAAFAALGMSGTGVVPAKAVLMERGRAPPALLDTRA